MISAPEAFSLLSVSDVSLFGSGLNPNNGVLDLQCVSMPHPQSTSSEERDVYLVVRLNNFEIPIDPAAIVTRTDELKARNYTFSGTFSDPSEFTLSVRGPFVPGDERVETLETFENILEQYVAEFRSSTTTTTMAGGVPQAVEPLTAGQATAISSAVKDKDLRGHLVMINEDTGEIIGEVEDRFRIKEDPSIMERGHENDPVVIQVPDDDYTRSADKHALEAFATIIPPDQRNWISTSANIVSHAISLTTNLLITTITTGASLYVAHSTPSPHHTGGASTPTDKGKTTASGPTSNDNTPPPLPPRALVFLTSERTRKGLSTVHALSGEAVKVSSKTVALIDSMIRRAMGAKPKRVRYFTTTADPNASSSAFLSPNKPPLPSRSRSPSPSPVARSVSAGAVPPPPYVPYAQSGAEKGPALPPRRSVSPAPPLPVRPASAGPSMPPFAWTPAPGQQLPPPPPPLPERRLKTKDHILISADLILSTLDDSARRVLDAGTEQIGRVMGHKYGPEAAQSSLHLAGTARNVGLVYIDMSGIGRRALLRRAGKTFLKARLSTNGPDTYLQPIPAPAPNK
ncbi:hypothetical protein BDN70DRAFT_848914 [Pholiota conissans]|uniref:Senescence domain-containing protein n=1 Tax=Pholiota conissans TaxID=109636 RepID=A0A9P5ZDG1_9AGAR|nr:hypothetical protein BDN70DRAFT_848914 [Pholiota conissans]